MRQHDELQGLASESAKLDREIEELRYKRYSVRQAMSNIMQERGIKRHDSLLWLIIAKDKDSTGIMITPTNILKEAAEAFRGQIGG